MEVQFARQTDQPLFPEIFWNRPTMRSRAGRLLIVGGQRNEFSLLHGMYQMAEAAGIGECIAAMPDSLKKMVGEAGFARFVPASTSGSLGKQALGELMYLAEDADATIIGANITNNAETAVMIESLVTKLDSKVVITEEAIGILKFHPELFTGNPNALVVTSYNGLLTLAANHHMPIAVRPNSGVIGRLEVLKQLQEISKCDYLIFDKQIMVAAEGEISLTNLTQTLAGLPAVAVAVASTFWVQNTSKRFAGLTGAAHVLSRVCADEVPTISSAATIIQKTLQQLEDDSWN